MRASAYQLDQVALSAGRVTHVTHPGYAATGKCEEGHTSNKGCFRFQGVWQWPARTSTAALMPLINKVTALLLSMCLLLVDFIYSVGIVGECG